jgi:hypothetical protein
MQRQPDYGSQMAQQYLQSFTGASKLEDKSEEYGRSIQQNNTFLNTHNQELEETAGKWDKISSIVDGVSQRLDTLNSQFAETDSYTSSYDPLNISTQKETLENRVKRQGWGTVVEVKHGVGTGQWVSYRIEGTKPLTDSVKDLTDSTDSLNETMQNALSPYYSQDPRTTKLGFRAGSVGNQDWLTGATNATAIDAVLGSGATAPGMANGGSFVVGGGYSANDNRLAMFPVASGEQVVVNRTPQGGRGQVVNIDNRIIIQGTVDAGTIAQLKISRYQQAQRMRAGLARA